jgi:DNA-binding LacI/PurR family transcriptional regulator
MDHSAARPAVMHDVARLAGVSHQTVSRVINNHPNVRAATRERVERAMAALDYRPNVMARGLVTRRSGLLGVVTVESDRYGPTSSLMAIERAARAAGYAVTVFVAGEDSGGGRGAVEAMAKLAVEGVIVIAPTEQAARAMTGFRHDLPVVAIEAGIGPNVPVVSIDQVLGARLATAHLLGLGHPTVWHVAGPAAWPEARERKEGWLQAVSDAFRPAPPVFHGDWSAASGYRAGRELAVRATGPAGAMSAVFVANDHMALGLIKALHEAGLRVPQDVSVVGFDDIPEAEYLLPPLTTVRQDFAELGRRGVEVLARVISGDTLLDSAPMRPELVVRASTAPVPA